jgi:threonine dehydrogenase-like Zn-dependent dehydrogenase
MAGMMRAAVQEKPEQLVIKDVPIPEISSDEVLIKVKYTGICGTDWSIYTGKYSADKLPLIPGHEFSGVITEVGKNARDLKEGDRITADINMSCGHCFYCKRGKKLMCPEFTQLGIHTNGTYAEYVKSPWELVHILPDSIDFMTGAFVEPVSCVIHSAKAMNLGVGSSIAIIGSGLGILHAAVAKLRGAAPVILIGRNAKRLDAGKEMGADVILNINETNDVFDAVRKLTDGRGADYVVEAVGTSETYEQALEMMRPGGTLGAFGITGVEDIVRLRPFDLVLGEKNIVGSCAGVDNDWSDAIELLHYERIKPQILFSLAVPLEDLEWALKELKTNKALAKVFVSSELTERKVLQKIT